MSNSIVQIGRQRFVSGLFWQSLSRRRELRKEALELAQKLNFDLLIVRIERDVAEAGFASSRDGVQPGLLSLGAMVSQAIAKQGAQYDGRQQPAPNWLGAFKLPDGRWAYFAVRDNLFLPNGDCLGSREEIFDRLIADYGLGGWNVVIGDAELESLGFHNFYQRGLDDLLPQRNGKARVQRWWALQSARRNVAMPLAVCAVAAVLVTGGAFGYMKYREHQREVEFERMVAVMRQRAAANGQGAGGAGGPAIVHPWVTQPTPAAFLRACVRAFGEMSPGGWQLDEYSCSPANASYVWSRNGSTVGYLLADLPGAQIDGSGDRAVLTVPLALPGAGEERLETERNMRLRLLNAFQPLGIALKLDVVQQREDSSLKHTLEQSLPGGQEVHPKAPDWRTWHVAADLGGLTPTLVETLFDQPGIRLDKVSYRDGNWSVEGEIYAK
ncbi:type 4b pilus protein PilO2 [Trinickia fusca]|uniref:PilO family protein n=1 Tax=Trinickia fusca TaxID=2419777 RepID=A0A494X4P8_9BURK|nr:type 4b pilus protein PilO2 [Trinickia fusca]RKP44651.1 pilO family protein [Trinickia fusca]